MTPVNFPGRKIALEWPSLHGLKSRISRFSSREVGDLIMLGIGGFTPLEGFMTKADWQGVCDGMKLASGLFWPIPITLSTDEVTAQGIKTATEVALVDASRRDHGDHEGDREVHHRQGPRVHAGLQDRRPRAPRRQDGDGAGRQPRRPGQGAVPERLPRAVPGPLHAPAETRKMFEEKGWSTVAAFQTRNPMHRSHEYLAKVAIEVCDGV
jgi:sulfate adenylyltransferase